MKIARTHNRRAHATRLAEVVHENLGRDIGLVEHGTHRELHSRDHEHFSQLVHPLHEVTQLQCSALRAFGVCDS